MLYHAGVRLGVVYMMMAALSLAAMTACIKMARVEHHAFDLLVWRGAVGIPAVVFLARRTGVGLRANRYPLVLLRVLLGVLSFVAFAFAARGLAVADLSLLYRLQPVLVALVAPFFLGLDERVDRTIWMILALSMVGVVLTLMPNLAVGSIFGAAALGAALASALGHVSIRALMRTEHPLVIVFYLQLLAPVFGLLAIWVGMGRFLAMPTQESWLPVLGVGVFSLLGQVFLTYAYRHGRASVVAAALYSGVFWAFLFDVLVFSVRPGVLVIAGAVCIVLAGLWLALLYRPRPRQSSVQSDDDRELLDTGSF